DVALLLEPYNNETIPILAGPYLTLEVGRFRSLDTRVFNHISAENAEILACKFDQIYFNSDFYRFMDYGKYRMGLEVNALISYYLHDRGILIEEEMSSETMRKRYYRYEKSKSSLKDFENITHRLPVKKYRKKKN